MTEIRNEMEARGYNLSENKFFYVSELDNTVIADIHQENAVMSPGGNLLVFDCEAFIKQFPVDPIHADTFHISELNPDKDTEAWKKIFGKDIVKADKQIRSKLLKELRLTGHIAKQVNGMIITMENPIVKKTEGLNGERITYYDGMVSVGPEEAFKKEHTFKVNDIVYNDESVRKISKEICNLIPMSVDIDNFLYNPNLVGPTVAAYGSGDLKKDYKNQLNRNGRIEGLVNNRYVVQLDPTDKTKVLISDWKNVDFMLWTNNSDIEGTGKLTPQEKKSIALGETIVKDGKELFFSLDKGRMDSKVAQIVNNLTTTKQPALVEKTKEKKQIKGMSW